MGAKVLELMQLEPGTYQARAEMREQVKQLEERIYQLEGSPEKPD